MTKNPIAPVTPIDDDAPDAVELQRRNQEIAAAHEAEKHAAKVAELADDHEQKIDANRALVERKARRTEPLVRRDK